MKRISEDTKYKLYNKELNSEFFDGYILKEKIRIKLLLIARYFYKFSKLSAPIKDIIFTGSSAGFNWGDTSDIDIHVIIDYLDVSNDYKLTTDYTYRLKNDWNNIFKNIKIYNHPVELYIEDIKQPVKATSIYSLLHNKWLVKPNKEKISVDKDYIINKYQKYITDINTAINEQNLESLQFLLNKIHTDRYNALKRNNEYDNDNIIFKILRCNGYINKLKSNITNIITRNLSI